MITIGSGSEVCEVIRRGGCPVWQLPADDPSQIASAMTDILKSDFPDTDQKETSENNILETRNNVFHPLPNGRSFEKKIIRGYQKSFRLNDRDFLTQAHMARQLEQVLVSCYS